MDDDANYAAEKAQIRYWAVVGMVLDAVFWLTGLIFWTVVVVRGLLAVFGW